jgi:FAD/FMN-containing dehydrogenase
MAPACRHEPEKPQAPPPGLEVTDLPGRLAPVRVAELTMPGSIHDVQEAVRRAKAAKRPISIAGGRHAIGGQPFGAGTMLLDMTGMKDVIRFDRERGLIEAEAGITWAGLQRFLRDHQGDGGPEWALRQRPIDAEKRTLGGAVASNAHGDGLLMKPVASDVESLILVDAEGTIRRCNRAENHDLFRLVIGGYGLYGVIAHAELRLAPRAKTERLVEEAQAKDLPTLFDRRIKEGFTSGEFRFAIDPQSEDFLRKGILSCRRPVKASTPLTAAPKTLSEENLGELLYLAHAEPAAAFERAGSFTLGTSGEVGWADEQGSDPPLGRDHEAVDTRLGAKEPGAELTVEVEAPLGRLPQLLEDLRAMMKEQGFGPIDGDVRLVETDDETFLPYAKERAAAVRMSLHVARSPAGMEGAATRVRRIIDLARARGGSFFLGDHRFATREQVEACYPQLRDAMARKERLDPEQRFQSEWYRAIRKMLEP